MFGSSYSCHQDANQFTRTAITLPCIHTELQHINFADLFPTGICLCTFHLNCTFVPGPCEKYPSAGVLPCPHVLFFPEIQIWLFIHWRQFAWNVKSCFLRKYKNISKCLLLKILARVLSVNLNIRADTNWTVSYFVYHSASTFRQCQLSPSSKNGTYFCLPTFR